jgi:hypothetical protein
MALVGRKLPQLHNAYDGAFIVGDFALLEFNRAPIDRNVLRGFALGWNSETHPDTGAG